MFDHASEVSSGPDSAVPRDALDAGSIRAVHTALVCALEDSLGLDGRGCVESMRALEELACTITAAQAELGVQLDSHGAA